MKHCSNPSVESSDRISAPVKSSKFVLGDCANPARFSAESDVRDSGN